MGVCGSTSAASKAYLERREVGSSNEVQHNTNYPTAPNSQISGTEPQRPIESAETVRASYQERLDKANRQLQAKEEENLKLKEKIARRDEHTSETARDQETAIKYNLPDILHEILSQQRDKELKKHQRRLDALVEEQRQLLENMLVQVNIEKYGENQVSQKANMVEGKDGVKAVFLQTQERERELYKADFLRKLQDAESKALGMIPVIAGQAVSIK